MTEKLLRVNEPIVLGPVLLPVYYLHVWYVTCEWYAAGYLLMWAWRMRKRLQDTCCRTFS